MKKLLLTLLLQGSLLCAAPLRDTLRIALPSFPQSMLYYVGFDTYSFALMELTQEPLLRLDRDTRQFAQGITEKFQNKNNREFHFYLSKNFKFSDGTPITSRDILATWESIMADSSPATPFKVFFASLVKPVAVDAHHLVFNSQTPIARPESLFSQLYVLSADSLRQSTFASYPKGFNFSGPYSIQTIDWGKKISLQSNPHYLLRKNRFQLENIEFLSNSDPVALLESFKKGQIDYYYFPSTKMWMTESLGNGFDRGFIKKETIVNKFPHSLTAIGWNLRRPIFQDRRTRLALQYLLDRKRIIHELLYDCFEPISGPFHHLSEFHHPDNQPIEFSLEKAKALLIEAGWNSTTDHRLIKDGRPFEFEIVTGTPSSARYLAWYQETLAQIGIQMKIATVDWSTYLKRRSEGNFDAFEFSRERELDASELGITFGNLSNGAANFIGYSNPELDKLLARSESLPDGKARREVLQKMDRLLAIDAPVAYLWEPSGFRIAFWDRYDRPKPDAYASWSTLFHSWSFDEKKNQKVEAFLKETEARTP